MSVPPVAADVAIFEDVHGGEATLDLLKFCATDRQDAEILVLASATMRWTRPTTSAEYLGELQPNPLGA